MTPDERSPSSPRVEKKKKKKKATDCHGADIRRPQKCHGAVVRFHRTAPSKNPLPRTCSHSVRTSPQKKTNHTPQGKNKIRMILRLRSLAVMKKTIQKNKRKVLSLPYGTRPGDRAASATTRLDGRPEDGTRGTTPAGGSWSGTGRLPRGALGKNKLPARF